MLSAGVVCLFPSRVNDRPLPHFHNAVTWAEAHFDGRLNKIKIRPLITVSMHVVSNLTEQDSFRSQDAICLFDEWGIHERKVVSLLLRRF